ncbi:MAG: hypothetical protein KJ000_17340 [Pirellulaceae bacterium]|nr:hypothetical protein [Pirellulaceae bacterium]
MTELGNIDDYRWLVSSDAVSWLEKAAQTEDDPDSLLRTTVALRRDLGKARTNLVIALVQLRRRGKVKFSQADRMFFTRQLLEQATDEQIGAYKAARYPDQGEFADICCGIGGDLISLARRSVTRGIDCDEVAALLAAANCDSLELKSTSVHVDEASQIPIADFAAWHVDPDRRPEGYRTTRLTSHQPDLTIIEQLLAANRQGAIKLAPAANVPEHWRNNAELEWIGNRGECRQLVAWFGDLAKSPGQRTATVLSNGALEACSIRGEAHVEIPLAKQVGRFVFEPHSAVLAADLTGVLANAYGLQTIAPGIPYLTGDEAVDSPMLARFEVSETMPFNIRKLRTHLRQLDIGHMEIKKRGVRLSPEHVLAELSLSGEGSATLLLMPMGKKMLAILCQRV